MLFRAHQIYVGNLEAGVTEDDIREFFAECGDIASVCAAAATLEVCNTLHVRSRSYKRPLSVCLLICKTFFFLEKGYCALVSCV